MISRLSILIVVLAMMLSGCAGGESPLVPQTPDGQIEGNVRLPGASMTGGGKLLWGMWQGTINIPDRKIELVPLRGAEFHANLAGILRNSEPGLSHEIKGFNPITGIANVDVTLTHPFPNTNFRGFDTRGIFMGSGVTLQSGADPGIIYPSPEGCRVLNADGYTRWWNAPEFTTAGMYGYDDPSVIPGFLIPTTTLNPYKYFADCLGPEDSVIPNVNMTNRGTFSTDSVPPELTRNYRIQFPKIGGQSKICFHYAVDVSWAAPTGVSQAPKPIEDFPIAANSPEPFHIEVDTTGTTAWYKSETERGGEVRLSIEIFDWAAPSNPLGIEGEIEAIWLESDTLFGAIYEGQPVADPGSDETSGIFNFLIPDVTPSGLDFQEVLITIRSVSLNDYAPPMYGPTYPESAVLSSYKLVSIPIAEEATHDIHVIKPNGNDLLMVGASPSIEWETSPFAEIDKVSILLSTNSGAEYDKPIALNVANTGSYIFYNIPETYVGCHNRIKVLDADNPSLFDESDADFTILPQLEDQIIVTAPNGGEEWIAETTNEIEWLADPNIQNVMIKLSMDSGETWPVIIVESAPSTDSKFVWGPIPQEYIGTNCRMAVHDALSPSIFDISDMDFSVIAPGIEIDTPASGEIWEVGDEVEIIYSASYIISSVDILLSFDGGADNYPYNIATDSPNVGSLQWTPDDPGIIETTQARIKICDSNYPDVYFDESDTFTILDRSLTLTYPDGGQEWRIGFPQTVEWLWTGNIPIVDIKMSFDGGPFENTIIENEPNTGSFDIAMLDAAWLTDHTIWDETVKEVRIRVESSTDSSLGDESESAITIPINLGILNSKNSNATGDMDSDSVKDDIEDFLGMNPEDFDSDRDGMYDFNELFHEISFNDYDLIPDADSDGEYAPNDNDDNGDDTHDGELVDSDNDGIPNYLEYYGYTYNWMSGEFLEWDDKWDVGIQPDYTLDYHKTDPLQPSTDQDPYGDGMETSGLLMDQSVLKPGNSPMIPACPNIIVRLEGYEVTLNADITDTKGGSETEGKNWNRETSQSYTSATEHNWGIEVGVETEFSITGGTTVSVKASAGGSYSSSNSTGTSTSTGESITETWDWSTTRATNPTETAQVKLFLKVYNMGTAGASNIIPTINLMVGRHPIATFEPGNSQINLLPPNGVYPSGDGVYWVVDSIDTGAGVTPIYLTLEELKAFETGAPISIAITQMLADVAAMNEQGYWEYVGDWNEYMSRVDAVCADIYLDAGDGNAINFRVYADDDPSAPEVTLGDALIWSAGAREEAGQLLVDYKLPDNSWGTINLADCRFMYDPVTWNTIQDNLVGNEFRLIDIPLTPGAVIIGKAPPDPPLDKPQIHWAGYDGAFNTVYASATDYYAISEVEFWDKTPDTRTPMTYDSVVGCYKLEMPLNFELLPGNEYDVVAINVDGFSNFFTIEEMDDLPEGNVESYPEVSEVSFAIIEELEHLSLNVSTRVEDQYYAIDQVFLLDSLENVIGQMEYDSDTGKFYYNAAIDPDYQPTGAEKIRAYNTSGYFTTSPIPAAAYTYPAEIYNEGIAELPGIGQSSRSDYESGSPPQPAINEDTDLSFYQEVPLNTNLRISLGHSVIQSYLAYLNLAQPVSRNFMKQLHDSGGFTGKNQYYYSQFSPNNLLYMFTTTEGRLAYIYVTPGYVHGIYRVYSLYNGPWDY